MSLIRFSIAAAVALIGLPSLAQTPLGTAFTYQGKLDDSGSGVNATVDLKFSLWDAPSGGSQIGPTLHFDGVGTNGQQVALNNGLFSVALDFGATAFDSNARWLNIEVRNPHDPSDSGPYIALTPRQAVTATPAAAFSQNTRGLTVDASSNVGIGTSSPAQKLSVAGIVQSTSGGFMFPDGSVLSTAAGIDQVPWSMLVNVPPEIAAWRMDATGTLAGFGFNYYQEANPPGGLFNTIACGYYHSMGIHPDGTLAAWGDNSVGQCNVPSGAFRAVAGGFYFGVAIRSDGSLAAWGDNAYGQLNVPSGTFTAVAAGAYYGVAIRTDGTLAAWGLNAYGSTNPPGGTFKAVSALELQGIGLRTDGTLAGWGNNQFGQINVPSGAFTAVACGGNFGLGLRSNGTLAAWGDNSAGQLNVPSGYFIDVAAAGRTGYALRSDGTVVGWGSTDYGLLNIPAGTFWKIAAGNFHTILLGGTRTLTCTQDTAFQGNVTAGGTIASTTGGFKFPDGTTQTTAANLAAAGWSVSGSNVLTTVSGNVGINTANPLARLQVQGGIAATGNAVSHNQGAHLEWNKQAGDGATWILNQKGFGAGGILFCEVDTNNSVTERMRIDGNGNLGVGTATPGFPISLANTTGDKLALWGQSGNHYGFGIQAGLLQMHTESSASDIAFGYGSSGSFTETARIKGNGRVGLGTAAPSERLHVVGNARIDGNVIVSGTISSFGGVFTESWNGTHTNHSTTATVMQDLPESDEFIAIPAGKAVLTWSMSCWSSAVARVDIHPMIGTVGPAGVTPFLFNQINTHMTVSGCCSVTIPSAMSGSVRLQWRSPSGAQMNVDANDHVSWTLTVYPQ